MGAENHRKLWFGVSPGAHFWASGLGFGAPGVHFWAPWGSLLGSRDALLGFWGSFLGSWEALLGYRGSLVRTLGATWAPGGEKGEKKVVRGPLLNVTFIENP